MPLGSKKGRRQRRWCAEPLEARTLLSATLLKDVNTSTLDSVPSSAVSAGNTVFFEASDGTQQGLWRTDGTAAGTQLVTATNPSTVAVAGTKVFAIGNYGDLWVANVSGAGTPVHLTIDQVFQPTQVAPAAVGGKLFFVLNGALWVTDGTQPGTLRVSGPSDQFGGYYVGAVVPGPGGKAIFTADDGAGHQSLWSSDGTAAGTSMFYDFPATHTFPADGPVQLTTAGGRVFFAMLPNGVATQLWATDGTAGGTTLLRDAPVDDLAAAGNKVYFRSPSPTTPNANALWTSDGTVAGTAAASTWTFFGAYPSDITAVGTELFFDGGGQLWKSDGTANGTMFVRSFPQPEVSSFVAVGARLYFTNVGANVNSGTCDIWWTDGTTVQSVATVTPPPASPQPYPNYPNELTFVPLGTGVFFGAVDVAHGIEPWTSNGTAAGTHVIADLNAKGTGSSPRFFTPYNGNEYFAATDSTGATGMWRTDGTAAGTLATGVGMLRNGGGAPFPFNGALFFKDVNFLLAKTNGTPAGTSEVGAINLTVSQFGPAFVNVGGSLYFAGIMNGQYSVFRSDGTSAGTTRVYTSPNVYKLLDFGGRLITGDSRSYVLLDGGVATTFFTAPPGLTTTGEIVAGGKLYFFVTNNTSPNLQLYTSDGTAAGTHFVAGLGAFRTLAPNAVFTYSNGVVLFAMYPVDGSPTQLWRTDGTQGGTTFIKSFYNLRVGNAVDNGLLSENGYVVFLGDTEVWRSDGTVAGTVPLTSFNYYETNLTKVNGLVYFQGGASAATQQLWVTDGTPAGTMAVAGALGTARMSDAGMVALGNQFIVAADDGVHGVEPMAISLGTGSLSGKVFGDANYNGTQDAGESGTAGVTVFQDATANGKLDAGEPTAVTDSSGNYAFSNLTPGAYVVREVVPGGFAQTAPLGYAANLSVFPGQSAVAAPLGNVRLSTVPMNAAYQTILTQHLGQPGTFAAGELNGDAVVNADDLLVYQQNVGHAIGGLINDPAGVGAVTLKQDAAHQNIVWTIGPMSGQILLADANGLTLSNAGGAGDVITLDYTNGNPLPRFLALNGAFTIAGLQGANPLANTALDLGRSTVFVKYVAPASDPLANVKAYLANGYNAGGWNGTATASTGAIRSAAAQNNPQHNTGIAWVDSAEGSALNTVANTILLKYAVIGDTDLDGTVGLADYTAVVRNFGTGTNWTQGVVTYDGTVGLTDYTAVVRSFGQSLPATSPAVSAGAVADVQASSTTRAGVAVVVTPADYASRKVRDAKHDRRRHR